jgi:hypothetical protein
VFVPTCIMLNFGLSHTINGLSKRQNLALVLYTNLLLLPTLLKIIKNELVFRDDQLICLLGMYICMYVCVCVCVCVCVYMYICILKVLRRSLCSIMRERERESDRERKKDRRDNSCCMDDVLKRSRQAFIGVAEQKQAIGLAKP